MSAEAATVPTADETGELTHRAIATTFALARDILADPSLLNDIPEGATLVLVPTVDPELAAAEVEQGLAALRRGEDACFRHVRSRTN